MRARIQVANERESKAWHALKSREDWERFRDVRLQALRASLGEALPGPKDLNGRDTKTLKGDGYLIDNLVVGESLIGWMAWDLRRGVDLLLAQRGADRELAGSSFAA